MRLAALMLLGVTTLGLLGLEEVPIASADSVRVIRSFDDFPVLDRYFGLTNQSCDAATAGQVVSRSLGDRVIEKGPMPVPLGSRTWGFDPSTPGAVGPFARVASMGSVAVDQMQVYSDSAPAQGVAFAEVDVDAGNAWYGVAPLTVSPGSWETVQGAGTTSYTWREVNLSSGATEGSPFTGSIDDMLTQVGGDRPGSIGLGFGCNGTGTFHFDDVRMDTTGGVIIFDYEGGISPTTITATPGTLTAGEPTQLAGDMSHLGSDYPSLDLVLQQRAFGSDRWRKVTTESDPIGPEPATYRAKPLRQTFYRWRFAGSESVDPSISKPLTVKVHTALRARAPDQVVLGSTFKVHGSTLPTKPGQTVWLWNGDHLLGTAKVTGKGTYAITAKATFRGRLRMVAKIAKSKGNLRGRSGTLVVKVR